MTEINEGILRMIAVFKRLEGLNLFPEKSQLSKTEFRLIREILLEKEKGLDIISSELARRLGLTRSAISQIVNKLEEKGIVERTAALVDRKIAYIRLSQSAIKAYEKTCRAANELMGRVVEEFGEDRVEPILNACEEFAAIFERVREEVKAK